jgi:DNA-binding NarL/FixJ family response regulator
MYSQGSTAIQDPVAPVPSRARVLIVDDEEIVHWGFRLLLGHQSWAERCIPALDADTALELTRRWEPHLAVVDTNAIDREPDVFAHALTAACQRTRMLLLTAGEAVSPSTVRAFGACGYVSRSWTARQMLATMRAASFGVTPDPPHRPADEKLLSARQQEILRLIADGATNTEIAARLFLSRHTVKQHITALYRKLDVKNRTHAVRTAQRRGLISV